MCKQHLLGRASDENGKLGLGDKNSHHMYDYVIPIHNIHAPPAQTQISSLCQAHTQNLGYKVPKIRLRCKPEQAELTDWSWHLIYQIRTNGLVCQNLQPLEVVTTSLLFMSSLFQVGPSRQDSSALTIMFVNLLSIVCFCRLWRTGRLDGRGLPAVMAIDGW